MAPEFHPRTIFHLVPTNEVAHDALLHPDNKRFVSNSKHGLSLKISYHVPSLSRGHVIARLGRNADLILYKSDPKQPMSAVHVAFQINPATHLILLSVRSKQVSSVSFAMLRDPEKKSSTKRKGIKEDTNGEKITEDGVILYRQNYKISITSYKFHLIWRTILSNPTTNIESLKTLIIQGYQQSLQLLREVRSRDRLTENDDSEAQSWYIIRLNIVKSPVFNDIKYLRVRIGSGAYGTVFEAVDQSFGYKFVIKVVALDCYSDIEAARALLHREIKVMERIRYVSYF